MKKEFIFLCIIVVGVLSSPLYADLVWHLNGNHINELTLDVMEIETVQLYCNDPTARAYDVTMGNSASTIADITQVTPLYLAGDWAYASPSDPDWWNLHCDWNPLYPQPISVWGDHWDVTIKGLSPGSYSLNSDYYGAQGANDILSITVIPEPCSILLLGLGGLVLRITNRKQG